MIISDKLKSDFKEVCFRDKEIFLKKFSTLFELPDHHYSKMMLIKYCSKLPKIRFEKTEAQKRLFTYFNDGAFFVLDYDSPNKGGYGMGGVNHSFDSFREDEFELVGQNWDSFLKDVEKEYWENIEKVSLYKELCGVIIFEDREPQNIRENFLAKGVLVVNDEKINYTYKFFDSKIICKLYDELISRFCPPFTKNKHYSDKNLVRYTKEIGYNAMLSLSIDQSHIEKELKMGYLEMPLVKFEFFDKSLKLNFKKDSYLKSQVEYPIARISPYFLGFPANSRIGNSSENEETLRRRLIFYLDAYFYVIRIYVEEIEANLKKVLEINGGAL